MHGFPKGERIIEVLSFKMLLNDAINNLRDLDIFMISDLVGLAAIWRGVAGPGLQGW